MNQTQKINLQRLKTFFNLSETYENYFLDNDLKVMFDLSTNKGIYIFKKTRETGQYWGDIMHIKFTKSPYPTLSIDDLKDIVIAIDDCFKHPYEFTCIIKEL